LARLALRFIEFDAQDVESWSETTFFVVSTFWPSNWYSHIQLTNGKVSQERKSAYAAKTDMLLPSRPSQRVIGIVRIWSWMQDKSAIVAISVKRDGAFRTVQLLESVKTHIGVQLALQTVDPRLEPVWVGWNRDSRFRSGRLFHSFHEPRKKGRY
jgi:hypothetical protein